MEPGYYFVKTVWHYPGEDVDCYETIAERLGPMTLVQAIDGMKAWLEQHPSSEPEDGFVMTKGMCVMECCDDVVDEEQQSARIEWIY